MTELRLHKSLAEIPAADWDRLAREAQGDASTDPRPLDPFTTHRFLMALEASGSTDTARPDSDGRSGWIAHPLVLHDGDRPVAALPMWLKTHSQGEYIFDHAWAEAWSRAGGEYYPKLQVAVPFTPVTGPRLLGPPEHRRALLLAAASIAEANGLSSLHVTFCTRAERDAAPDEFLRRTSTQFHWHNHGFADFEAFLASLSSRKRKMIRKERAAAQAHGLEIRALTGDAIEAWHWDAFWSCYQDTGARKWGRPYLTRAAFDALHASMRDDMLLVMAFDAGRPVAAALNFIGREALFGRWWGTLEDLPFLHFELCYYQAMDWAIAQGLGRVEAGAQGEHKLARGYLPSQTHSLHWIGHPGFRAAVAEHLAAEAEALAEDVSHLESLAPFRKAQQMQDPRHIAAARVSSS